MSGSLKAKAQRQKAKAPNQSCGLKHKMRLGPSAWLCQIICCTAAIWGYLARMDWQQLVSLVIVAVAAGLLVKSKLRRKRFSWERDTHCGCVGAAAASTPGTIIFR